MSGRASASRVRKDIVGGFCSGYEEASVRRMSDICVHGAAQAV